MHAFLGLICVSHLCALRGPRRHAGQPQLRAERRLLARDPLARAARRAVGGGGGRGGGGQQREEGHQQLEGPTPRNHITALCVVIIFGT